MKEAIVFEKNTQPAYTHLEPLVDYLLAQGNELARQVRWHNDMAAIICSLINPIDFDALEQHFAIPDHIRINREQHLIECDESWCTIQGNIGKKL